MEVTPGASQLRVTRSIAVEEASQVAAVRRIGAELSSLLGFEEAAMGRVALTATELATNLLKHAGRGEVLLSAVEGRSTRFVEIAALDRGPGMANPMRCFEDGFSTAGSAGTGLGAVRRMASWLDVYSRPAGTAVVARITADTGALDRGCSVDGLSVARQGEEQCGDAWDHETRSGIVTLLIVDGLGHGGGAAEAALEAVRAFRQATGGAPAARVEAIHGALRSTRGAAVAVVELDGSRRVARFAGLGNVAASIYGDGPVRHLVSHHGTAGHTVHRIVEYSYPWPARALLVMHSDGIASLRDLDPYPGLLERDPGTVTAVLYRDFCRRRDDATVVAARNAA